MAQRESKRTNFLILSLVGALCLSIPIFYVFFDQASPDPREDAEILDSSGKIRADYDPGVAWLQSKPIMIPNGHGSYYNLRATLRMKDRESADTICMRHPHLADIILTILTANKELLEDALAGKSMARKEIHMAIEGRLGGDMFTETIISDENLDLMKASDKVRYECGGKGLRFVFRDPPEGLKQD
ncbi:hypothetical protein [Curvivirga sp.]|uniref:hypothetical protein n=1 Tax=Curvivirga sp. TaxID=2856848 RepID=UPI003B5B5768